MLVRQILAMKGGAEVVTVPSGTRVSEAARTLSEKRIGAIVVADGDSPQGILSERDIVRELGKRGDACLLDAVDSLMTKEMITCAPEETADQVLQKMTDGRFRHMPVMDGGQLTGVISIGDVVKARISEVVAENSALTEMISGNA